MAKVPLTSAYPSAYVSLAARALCYLVGPGRSLREEQNAEEILSYRS